MRNITAALVLLLGCGSSVEEKEPPAAPPACEEAGDCEGPAVEPGHFVDVPACEANDDCDDGDPCTADKCGKGVCMFYPRYCS